MDPCTRNTTKSHSVITQRGDSILEDVEWGPLGLYRSQGSNESHSKYGIWGIKGGKTMESATFKEVRNISKPYPWKVNQPGRPWQSSGYRRYDPIPLSHNPTGRFHSRGCRMRTPWYVQISRIKWVLFQIWDWGYRCGKSRKLSRLAKG